MKMNNYKISDGVAADLRNLVQEAAQQSVEFGVWTYNWLKGVSGSKTMEDCIVFQPQLWCVEYEEGNPFVTSETPEKLSASFFSNRDSISESTRWERMEIYKRGVDKFGLERKVCSQTYEKTTHPEVPDCYDDSKGHVWSRPKELVGGLDENPGVWGNGGGVVVREVCILCGCIKKTDTWAQNPYNGEQGLTSIKYLEDECDVSDYLDKLLYEEYAISEYMAKYMNLCYDNLREAGIRLLKGDFSGLDGLLGGLDSLVVTVEDAVNAGCCSEGIDEVVEELQSSEVKADELLKYRLDEYTISAVCEAFLKTIKKWGFEVTRAKGFEEDVEIFVKERLDVEDTSSKVSLELRVTELIESWTDENCDPEFSVPLFRSFPVYVK